ARACYSFTLDTNSLSFKRIAENKDKVREKLLPSGGGSPSRQGLRRRDQGPPLRLLRDDEEKRSSLPCPSTSGTARACYSFTLDTNSLSFKRIAENKDKVREKLLP
ncbi:hypothetical protein, partial [Streptococcus pneumoniae]|uniref:hypothetical protein n=1 Tax=Streptococcus pneumoniae TaxID=1313 RepID=UPI001CB76F7E